VTPEPPATPETPASAVPNVPVVEPVAAGGSGGGALSSSWLLGLAVAVAVLVGGRRPKRPVDAA
jgi:hypothetical protein